MTGENDISTRSVQRNYESLPPLPKAPVKPDTQKTDIVEKKVLGSEEKRTETHAQFIARRAINAYEQSEASRQPPPSFLSKLVSLVVNYLKEKFSRKPAANVEVSRPFNVKGGSLEKRLERQLVIVDFNMRHPDKPIQLDKELPQTHAELREAIDQLLIASNPVSRPSGVKITSLQKKLQDQLDAIEHNMRNKDQIPLDPTLPKTRTELKEALNQFVSSPFNVKETKAKEHLAGAKKQLASLKHNLSHPREKQLALSPEYPKAIISLDHLIDTLETKLNDIETKRKENVENNVNALEDLMEDREIIPGRTLEELAQDFDNDLVPHQGIDHLNSTIKDLERELEYVEKYHKARMDVLVKNKTNTERNEMLLNRRYQKELHSVLDRLTEARMALYELETSRSPLTKGELREAEAAMQEVAVPDAYSEKILDRSTLENMLKILDNQIDQLEGKKSELLFSDKDASKLQRAINQLTERRNTLAEMKQVREDELELFNETIENQERELAQVIQEFEEISNSEDLSWKEKKKPSLELVSKKEELEMQIAHNKNIRIEILDELGILNAGPARPSIQALRDLKLTEWQPEEIASSSDDELHEAIKPSESVIDFDELMKLTETSDDFIEKLRKELDEEIT